MVFLDGAEEGDLARGYIGHEEPVPAPAFQRVPQAVADEQALSVLGESHIGGQRHGLRLVHDHGLRGNGPRIPRDRRDRRRAGLPAQRHTRPAPLQASSRTASCSLSSPRASDPLFFAQKPLHSAPSGLAHARRRKRVAQFAGFISHAAQTHLRAGLTVCRHAGAFPPSLPGSGRSCRSSRQSRLPRLRRNHLAAPPHTLHQSRNIPAGTATASTLATRCPSRNPSVFTRSRRRGDHCAGGCAACSATFAGMNWLWQASQVS